VPSRLEGAGTLLNPVAHFACGILRMQGPAQEQPRTPSWRARQTPSFRASEPTLFGSPRTRNAIRFTEKACVAVGRQGDSGTGV
jgi:hypothetical protein